MFKNQFNKYFAFTIAEILIVLGIIGIVAEMTIPSIYSSYQKQLVSVKLQKFYSMMSQAITRSEVDNGPMSSWDSSTSTDANWFTKYLSPYLRYSKITISSPFVAVVLSDGTYIFCKFQTDALYIIIHWGNVNFWDGANIMGKNDFWFQFDPTKPNGIVPYGWGSDTRRSTWLSACISTQYYCTGLLMLDNWQVKSDYPFFN